MSLPRRVFAVVLLFSLCTPDLLFSSAYNGRPKLILILVIDQFRGDYLERYRDQFVPNGFRLLMDKGAYFSNCNYNYANTRTAPGHATLLTGAYTNGHGIVANEWWNPAKKAFVTSVEDDATKLVGISSSDPGASPHNLLADTLGDEMKLATHGKARVFGISLKDRAAVLPAGFSGEAYWIDHESGAWITSSYYREALPKWVQNFNDNKRSEKYLNKEWNDEDGKVLRTTAPQMNKKGKPMGFYDLVGSTPFANDYEFEFARELITYEKLGEGPATDLLVISLSANDILGHQVGPDSPEMQSMALTLDKQLAEFFDYLGHQIGLANIWIALSADHGVAPLPSAASQLHIPAANLSAEEMKRQVNDALMARFAAEAGTEFVTAIDYPVAWLNPDAFIVHKALEATAEEATGKALETIGMRGYFTKSQLAKGDVPQTELGIKYLHSYSPEAAWYVLGVPVPFDVGSSAGTDHASPYTYDTHVPLAFYGLPFVPGTYRTHAEPVDMAVTLASLLGINAPTHAVGRVLTEALVSAEQQSGEQQPAKRTPAQMGGQVQ
jgi:hypothetical protein